MTLMTPVRRQYLQVKKQHPEAIVLFRLGDFYETFDDDAKLVARELEITLTSREMGKGQRVPLAGIPYHALDNYLARLVGRGHKVAICEQMAEASEVKGIIPREVVRVITPGTVVEANLLVPKENNYLAAALADKGVCGVAYVDVTTGEFATTQLSLDALYPELERLRPAELLVPRESAFISGLDFAVSALEGWSFELENARELLLDHFGVASLEGYGCAHLPLAVRAAGAVLQYLSETQKSTLRQLTALSTYSVESFMVLDPSTRRSLDLLSNSRSGGTSGSLLSVLDQTRSPMGGRLLRRWLSQPLLDLDVLVARQDSIGAFHRDATLRAEMGTLLSHMPDMERLTNRVSAGGASPREVVALGHALEASGKIRDLLAGKPGVDNKDSLPSLDPVNDLCSLILEALVDSPPASLNEGGVIREGFSAELDQIKNSVREARQFIAGLERGERERTGVKSLKVGYNRVFGYYIEVSKANASQVPSDYVRKQTLVGAERFVTPELKEFEDLILNAQERMVDLEATLFRQVCQTIASRRESLLNTAGAVARLDTFCSLAELAVTNNYVRPELTEEEGISILGGRHPVVERHLAPGEVFVPNDTVLCSRDAQIAILTGPNMAGKSTYLRQVALIILLAQIGSFVPAQSARLGLVDRIFRHVPIRRPLPAGNRQQSGRIDMDRVVARQRSRGCGAAAANQRANAHRDAQHIRPRRGAVQILSGRLQNEGDLLVHGARLERRFRDGCVGGSDQRVPVPRDGEHHASIARVRHHDGALTG